MSAVERPFLNPACDAARYTSTRARIRRSTIRDSTLRSSVSSMIGRRLARAAGLAGFCRARSIPSPIPTDLCRLYDLLSTY